MKNPGLLLNALSILNKSLDFFPIVVEECLNMILEKTLSIIEVKKTEIGQTTQKFLTKLFNKVDPTKLSKELLKISAGNNQKVRVEALTQTINIWKENPILGSNIQNVTIKVLQKLSQDVGVEDKVREIIHLGIRKFGLDFLAKVQEHERLSVFLE